MGIAAGLAVGLAVVIVVGFSRGFSADIAVGLAVDIAVGLSVGLAVDTAVGLAVGCDGMPLTFCRGVPWALSFSPRGLPWRPVGISIVLVVAMPWHAWVEPRHCHQEVKQYFRA